MAAVASNLLFWIKGEVDRSLEAVRGHISEYSATPELPEVLLACPDQLHQVSGALRIVPVAGKLSFGRNMPRGAYTLRVTVSQARGGKVERQASQWVDFEVR